MSFSTKKLVSFGAILVVVFGCAYLFMYKIQKASPKSTATTQRSASGNSTPVKVTKREVKPCGTESGEGCALTEKRVDLVAPVFSHSTKIDNPLYPVSSLKSSVFIGLVDDLPFRTETTLLPKTRIINVNGAPIETLEYQYMAFSGGRLQEIAKDWFAQDDAGNVWYLGEDVADYNETGRIFTHEGTWLAGVDNAPISMIMAAHPKVGDVWQAEDTAPEAWEEITVKETGLSLIGPSGPIANAIIGSELHMDGTRQQKIFAPGYGEFQTGSRENNDLEALALSIPTDAQADSLPAELKNLSTQTATLYNAVRGRDFTSMNTALTRVSSEWSNYKASNVVSPLLANEVERIFPLLRKAASAKNTFETALHAVELARPIYDLRLRYQPIPEIDQVRFDLWMAQVPVDAERGDAGSLRGDVASASLVLDRFVHTLDGSLASRIHVKLDELTSVADKDDLNRSVTLASEIRGLLPTGWK
ncbi:MAG: hypothetical protein WAT81_04980 [Candidatus Moraniibacteriota bacterium]